MSKIEWNTETLHGNQLRQWVESHEVGTAVFEFRSVTVRMEISGAEITWGPLPLSQVGAGGIHVAVTNYHPTKYSPSQVLVPFHYTFLGSEWRNGEYVPEWARLRLENFTVSGTASAINEAMENIYRFIFD